MKSEIKVYDRGNGEVQRVQVVSWDDWTKLEFLFLKQENMQHQKHALKCFCDIYQNYLLPACPWIFPQMVMFALPEEDEVSKILAGCVRMCSVSNTDENETENGKLEGLSLASKEFGKVNDPLTIATIVLQSGVKIKNGKPVFLNETAGKLYRMLEEKGFVHIVCGKFPGTKVIPVSRFAGYISEEEPDAKMKVNANFFIMDPIDCVSVFDQVGMPFGLCVKNGIVLQPPMCNREMLAVMKDGRVIIAQKDIKELEIEIQGNRYVHGKNAVIYTRPERSKTPSTKEKLVVVIGRKVVAIKQGGNIIIPASGFVMEVDSESQIHVGDDVVYHGCEDTVFAIQVGNSIVRDGKKTEEFISRFYDIKKLQRIPYPPSLCPMDFKKARAGRIGLGADKDGKPVVFWAEGKGKLKYIPGEDSTGASLTEMAEIAEDLGLYNAVNLDGGGSAQILLNGERSLRISDRNKEDNSDAERLVPLGLIVK